MSGGRRLDIARGLALLGLAAAFALVAAPPARAQEARPSVEVRVELDPPTSALGERVRLLLTVEHDADQLITPGRVDGALAVQLVEDATPVEREAGGGRLVSEFAYTLAAFELGGVELGATVVRALRDDGSTVEVPVALPALTVEATTAADDQTLRPLKPQRAVSGAPAAWQRAEVAVAGAVVGATLLLGALAWWLVRALLRRRGRRRAPPPAPAWPVEEAARARLDGLAARGAPASAQAATAYHREIAAVVREYLEARFAFAATALTTGELEARMTGEGVDRWQARLVGGLLERCDAAVYAHRHPDRDSADHDLTVAYEIVELGRARPETAAEEQAAGEALLARGGRAR